MVFWNTATRWVAIKLNSLSTQFPPPPKEPDDKAPRKILLVQAHPREDSLSFAIGDAVVQGAKEGNHEIRRRNLCQEGFVPQLTATERGAYFDTAKGAARLAKETQSHLRDLRWCDSLVLVYPTWWFNVPAILKGYFDRTLVPGKDCAWDFPSKENDPDAASNGLVPRLTNVKRMLGISTYGASRTIATLAGDNGRNMIGTAIRPNFNPECPCTWMALYDMDFKPEAERTQFLADVKRVVRDEL